MVESTRQRIAFNLFWYLGPRRSLQEVQRTIASRPQDFGFRQAPHRRTLERWSTHFSWQDRLADLEAEARQRDREGHLDELRLMNDRHSKEGLAFQQKALERLKNLAADDIAPETAIRFLVEGIKLERLARGEATERTRLEGELRIEQVDLSQFTEQELRRLAGLEPGGGGGPGAAAPR